MEPQALRTLFDQLRRLPTASTADEAARLRSALLEVLKGARMTVPYDRALTKLDDRPAHTVLVLIEDQTMDADLYSVPDSEISPPQRAWLHAIKGLSFAESGAGADLGPFAAAIRVLAAVGKEDPDDWEELYDDMVEGASDRAHALPSPDEIKELLNVWLQHRVRAGAPVGGDGLNRPITEVITFNCIRTATASGGSGD
ncbi:MAG TPA: hypothetical protein VKN99_04655 [Polyangia bacterium]|nr:hypothetical protein [Polyangia bacterium]